MLGAVIGDLAGSIYEYDQFKKVSPIIVENLINQKCFISDDTVLTMAIIKAVLTDKNYEAALKDFGLRYEKMLPSNTEYFETLFSPGFCEWLHGTHEGVSCGNGAMMRISPIGFLFNTEEEVEKNALLATIPSHNSTEAIDCAIIIAKIILFARLKYTKEDIINKLNLKIIKPHIEKFNYTCKQTIDICLYSLFSSDSFEESIKMALSFGGDTDTNACIVGSMAEAMFGIDKKLKTKALSYLPKEFQNLLNAAYEHVIPKNKYILRTDTKGNKNNS